MKTENTITETKTQKQLIRIAKRLEIAEQLVTDDKFYKYWFKQLSVPENRDITSIDVFNKVNDLYKDLFKTDQGRYINYQDFRNTIETIRKEPV